jgi:hypothetical protein
VNAVAAAFAAGRDCTWVAKRHKGTTSEEWLKQFNEGCEIIATGLRRLRVPTF